MRVHHDRAQFPGPRAHRERVGLVLLLVLALATYVTVAARAAGPSTGVTPAAHAAGASTPAVIPVAEISQRAEEVNGLLRALERDLRPSAQIEKIEHELGPLSSRLDARVDRTRQTLQSGAELGLLDTLTDLWQTSRMGLAAWVETLTVRATWLEQQRAALVALAETWTLTRTEARAAKVPPTVFQRITDVLGAIAETQAKLDGQRSAMLVLQDRVARELSRCVARPAWPESPRSRLSLIHI